jgi:1-acyl-sn-glycerol-3-phosphate acyltransferase
VNRLRGALFYGWFYLSMGVCGALFFLPALVSPVWARALSKLWMAQMFLSLRLIGGVRTEIRGDVPRGFALIAAKHQSMLDVWQLYLTLPFARFVMKRELTRAPVFGWFALRVGTVAVDRGGGRPALQAMVAALRAAGDADGQIVIYPQGTRTPPGVRRDYKVGVHAVYEAMGAPCIPVALNSGLRQPRGVAVRPGFAVLEFLPPIPPGLPRDAFMARLEAEIEAASDRLAREHP